MKAIKITTENLNAIKATLDEINGRATAHVYSASEIIELAQGAESRVYGLLGRKDDMKGAVLHACSGTKVAKSYRGKRIATRVKLERRSSEWWLVDASTTDLFPDQGGYERLSLTTAQDARAVEVLREQYRII